MKGAQTHQKAGHLVVAQLLQELGQSPAAVLLEGLEDLTARRCQVNQDHPTVIRVTATFDHPTSRHPADDPGCAGDRDIERCREATHRHRAIDLDQRQDVEVDQTEGAAGPRTKHAHPLTRRPQGQLFQKVVGQLPSTVRSSGYAMGHADSQ